MILADTSIWIEFLRGHEPIATTMQEALERQRIIAAECVFGELLQGAKDRRERTLLLDYWRNVPQPDATGLWVEAGILASIERHPARGIGLIDTFLIVLAQRHRARLWTLDKKLLAALPTVLR